MDAANLLKPALARGKLRTIGATTLAEYRKYIEKDQALVRRFQEVLVDEPSVPAAISILRGISEKYSLHHGVSISDAALVQAAQLAHRYLTTRKLPDSAIDLVGILLFSCLSVCVFGLLADISSAIVNRSTKHVRRSGSLEILNQRSSTNYRGSVPS